MSAARPVDFAGPDAELEKLLREFAGRTGAVCRRPKPDGPWLLFFGVALATNPNDVGFRLRVWREGDAIRFGASAIALPWNRRKLARIVAFREGQLADYLTARLRGGGPEKFEPLRLREPFSSWGSGPAALSTSYAWAAAAGVAGLFAALIGCTLAFFPLLWTAGGDIAAHSRLVEAAGVPPLPSAGERESVGAAFLLASAFVFGAPIAFLAAVLHGLALAVGESAVRFARFPQATFAFLALGTAVALFNFTPVLAIPAALLVPLSAHVGYTLVWSKRGERLREGPRPKPGVVLVGVLLAVGGLAAMAPAVGEGPMQDRLALFRDRFLLGNPLGRAFSILYYRTTLYGAWPMKSFFTTDADHRPARGQPVAEVHGVPTAETDLAGLGFVIKPRNKYFGLESTGRLAPVDAVVSGTRVSSGAETVALAQVDRAELARALDELAGRTWRGRWLRELQGLGWAALFFAGFPVLVLIVAGASAPFVAVMYKAMSFKAATISLGACVLMTVLLMILGEAAVGDVAGTIRQVREDPAPERLARALAHPSVVVRHEAAYAATRLKVPAPFLVEPLLKAADDPDLRVRLWAVAALGRTKSPKALDRLLARLEDRELFVRYRAAEGLGFLGMREAVEPLQKRMREGTWYEGTYAWEAIRRIESARP